MTALTLPAPGLPTMADDAADRWQRARELAARQWARWAPLLAQLPLMRLSPDGGESFGKWHGGRRYERPLSTALPTVPATVYLCDPHTGTSRVLVADFDVSRGCSAETVRAQAADFAARVQAAGGQTVRTVSPSGGRHVWVRLAEALPHDELRQLATAIARRYPSMDTAVGASRFSQLRPPGAPHKLARGAGRLSGFVLLDMTEQQEADALAHLCGPQVWAALLDEYAGELQASAPALDPCGTALDAAGVPWRPREGGRRPLPAKYATLAVTGAWAGYDSRSEARLAVLSSAAAAGWRLADVRTEMDSGRWPGLVRLTAYKSTWHLEHDWKKATSTSAPRKPGRNVHTRGRYSTPPTPYQEQPGSNHARSSELTDYQMIRQWQNAVRIAERDPAWRERMGRRQISIRLVLRALGAAAQMHGSTRTRFGVRSLGEATGLHESTVAKCLRRLREDQDALIVLDREAEGEHPDEYTLQIPDAYLDQSQWMRWRAGRITAIHPALWPLGGAAALLYEALSTAETGGADLSRLAALSPTATNEALRDLAAYGLAERGPAGWRRGPAALDRAAGELDAWQLHAAMRDRHREDRRRWRDWLGIIARESIRWVDSLVDAIPGAAVTATDNAVALITAVLGGQVLRGPPPKRRRARARHSNA